jgi:biopolymer transport protein ExbB/TolQ|tara:strand:+ start:276 stop:485 length:210 start_codon:yes stop_codon:yes gene_type:complete
MNNLQLIKLSIIFFLISTNASYAYLDPGTSGAFIATILGIMAAGWTYIKNKILQVLQIFKKKFIKKKNN